MFVTGFAEDYFDKHVSPQDKKNMIQCCELFKKLRQSLAVLMKRELGLRELEN